MKMIFQVVVVQGIISVDDTITGIKVFRDNLFVFCEVEYLNYQGLL